MHPLQALLMLVLDEHRAQALVVIDVLSEILDVLDVVDDVLNVLGKSLNKKSLVFVE
jgi:hypothetical protein